MCRTEILNSFGARTVLLLFLLSTLFIRCDIGSDTAPSRQAFVVISSSPNTIKGFAGMYNGFMLYSSTAVVTFNSSFPVGTTMILNGGTINLSQDLFFASEAIIGSSGIINGNNHTVEFAPNDQVISLPYLGQTNLVNQQNAPAAVRGISWTLDNQYIVAASKLDPSGGPGITYSIYQFNGFK